MVRHPVCVDNRCVEISSTRASSVDLFSAPREGIRRGIAKADESAKQIAEGDVSPDAMIGLLEAKIAVKANAASLRAADEMLGFLLDTKA